MAKTDRSGSAAQRRAQERQQRQRKEEVRASALSKGKKTASRGPTMRKKDRTGLYMGIIVAALLVVIVVAFIIVRNWPAATNPAFQRSAADQTVVLELTNVPQSAWEAVGKGSATKSIFTYHSGQPPLTGSHGHPEFFYVGGEFCPYCGAQRWAIINALGRFGTFSNLSQTQAYEYNVPTFSFYGSKYTSSYMDFNPKEVKGNALNSDQTAYVDLEKLTAVEQANFKQFDSGQNFPYVNIGNRYIAIGAGYPFTTLLDSKSNPLSWQNIASSLSNPKSTIAQGILGTANYLTAGICDLTNQQPGNVCNVATIQQLEKDLKTPSSATPTTTPTTGTTPTPGTTPAATPTKTGRAPGGNPPALAPTVLQADLRRMPI